MMECSQRAPLAEKTNCKADKQNTTLELATEKALGGVLRSHRQCSLQHRHAGAGRDCYWKERPVHRRTCF